MIQHFVFLHTLQRLRPSVSSNVILLWFTSPLILTFKTSDQFPNSIQDSFKRGSPTYFCANLTTPLGVIINVVFIALLYCLTGTLMSHCSKPFLVRYTAFVFLFSYKIPSDCNHAINDFVLCRLGIVCRILVASYLDHYRYTDQIDPIFYALF